MKEWFETLDLKNRIMAVSTIDREICKELQFMLDQKYTFYNIPKSDEK